MITLQALVERDTRPVSVTVSMLSYNHEKYIDQAIQSVLMQKTNFPVNIVIHDDASTDRSAEIIRRYAAENPNIIPILEETNLYQNGKPILPVMFPYYTGKYMAYCECDDYWLDENKLQLQVDYLESNPDCMTVCSNILPVNKFSEYDESCRGYFIKTEEGDCPPDNFIGTGHQIATYLVRNFYTFMNEEEINFFCSNKANGDHKLSTLSLMLGRVHYFKEEFAAHRVVVDSGDSWSARYMRLSPYEKSMIGMIQEYELLNLIDYFSGRKYIMRKLELLYSQMRLLIPNIRDEIRTKKFSSFTKKVSLFIYALLPFYVIYRIVKKVARYISYHEVIMLE